MVAGEAAAVPEAAIATIAPPEHCMPAGTAPMSWTAPDPQRDQVEVDVQVISPSVQEPLLEVEEGVAGAALATEEAAAVGAATAEVSAGEDATGATLVAASLGELTAAEEATGAEEADPDEADEVSEDEPDW